MSFLQRAAALEASGFRSLHGLPPATEMPLAQAAVAALPMLGIMPEPTWAVPHIFEQLGAALGVVVEQCGADGRSCRGAG
eukprot:1442526-Prymnesium_polylepis.1